MSLTLLSEPSAVVEALEHLERIGEHFEKDELGYDREIMCHLTATGDAIKDLEAIRRYTREKLEMVTIENCKLRFKLAQLPGKISEEIEASILAARKSNAVQINQLQAELKHTREEMECLQKEEHDLQTQNAFLGHQAKKLWEENEQAVDRLNQRMAMKAQESINLNEIYNKVQDIKEKTSIIMENTKYQKEELAEEKRQFKEEIENLNEENGKLEMNIEIQSKQNLEKQEYINELTAMYSDIESKVNSEEKRVFQTMDKLEQLRATYTELIDLLNDQKETHELLTAKKQDLEFQLVVLEENFNNLKMIQEEKITEITDELTEVENINKNLTNKNTSLNEIYQSVRDEEEKKVEVKLNATTQLEEIITNINKNYELLLKLEEELEELEKELERIKTINLVKIASYERELEEQRGNLDKEKTKRILLQNKRGDLERQSGFWKMAEKRITHEMNGKIEAARRKYNELKNGYISIHEEFLHLDASIELINNEYSKVEEEFKAKEYYLMNEIKLLEEQLIVSKVALIHDENILKEKLPVLQDLKNTFDKETENHEEMKTYLENLTEKLKSVDISTNMKKKTIVKLTKVKEKNTVELKEQREAVLEQMQKQSDDFMALEKDIYEANRKLELAQVENSRLKLCNLQLRENISEEFMEAKRHMTAITIIQKKMKTLSESFLQGWKRDHTIHKNFSENDHETLDAMKELIRKIQEREETIGDFSGKMQEQCNKMSSVLESKTKINLGSETSDKTQ
uniref:Myosin-9-like isoform X1 n=1 Tax=Geotrypetes seraphini TaxID=260995 RepID=A0A6P8RRA8_GEOSA|nr:myosin-9-like isoform X1 [Geotrypetes seraphini]